MIHTIDLHFINTPEAIAAFAIPSTDGVILVETGPSSTFEHLKKGLATHGFSIQDVRHVLLTHIHLDHAGATWSFAEQGANIYVHPRGKKHLMDPSRLMASAKMIYKDQMDTLWGAMNPIAEQSIQTPAHGEQLQIGEHLIKAWHTPGHASHHIAWQLEDIAFTGDVAGVKIGNGPVVAPCPPPDIDIEAWQQSIDLLRDLNLKKLYLTHFNGHDNPKEILNQLEDAIKDWSEWIKPYFTKGAQPDEILAPFEAYVQENFNKLGLTSLQIKQYQLANPSWMSVYGLMRYWRKKTEKKS